MQEFHIKELHSEYRVHYARIGIPYLYIKLIPIIPSIPNIKKSHIEWEKQCHHKTLHITLK